MKVTFRLPLVILSMAALLAALWAGLIRLGWTVPAWQPGLAIAHGPLMVCGFLGTLISLERAVSLNHRLTYLVPLITGIGGVCLWAGISGGAPLITLGSLGLVTLFGLMLRRHLALHTGIMALGAALWLAGNLVWLSGRPLHQVSLWWAGFLILTIAGERLELSRILRPPRRVQQAFALIVILILAGLTASLWTYDVAMRVSGLGFLALAGWLLRYDIARRTVRQRGLTRYIAVCLLSGYFWLGAGGLLALIIGGAPAGVYYDAILHAWFLGFVFAMIFGHAPIIFPAILNRPIRYRPFFYLPLLLLHLSLLLRLPGDLTLWLPGRRWGGLLNAIVLLLFLFNIALSLRLPAVPPENT